MDREFIIFTMYTVQVFVHVNCTNDVVTLLQFVLDQFWKKPSRILQKKPLPFFQFKNGCTSK